MSKLDLSTAAAINKEIDGIKAAGSKLDARIQNCAVAVIVHYAAHNDVTLVNRMYNALSKGARKTAMASWLMAYAAVNANTGPDKAENPFVYAKDKATDPVGAAGDMWYDHKPDASPDEVFDLQKAMKAMIAKASKAKSIKNGSLDALRQAALACGIEESDIPSKLAD